MVHVRATRKRLDLPGGARTSRELMGSISSTAITQHAHLDPNNVLTSQRVKRVL